MWLPCILCVQCSYYVITLVPGGCIVYYAHTVQLLISVVINGQTIHCEILIQLLPYISNISGEADLSHRPAFLMFEPEARFTVLVNQEVWRLQHPSAHNTETRLATAACQHIHKLRLSLRVHWLWRLLQLTIWEGTIRDPCQYDPLVTIRHSRPVEVGDFLLPAHRPLCPSTAAWRWQPWQSPRTRIMTLIYTALHTLTAIGLMDNPARHVWAYRRWCWTGGNGWQKPESSSGR